MPNSDFTVTRTELVTEALQMVGEGNPTTNEIIQAVKRLNALIKRIDARGRWLWTVDHTETSLTLVVGQSEYATGATATTIATNILELEYVAIQDSAGNRDPLRIVSASEALKTSLKDDNGEPEIAHLERAPVLTDQKMHFYPVPTQPETIVYTYRRRLYDFDASTDNPDFPQEWLEPLVYMLAYRLSHSYGLPLQERQFLKQEAELAMKEMRAFNQGEFEFARQESEYF